MIIYLLIFNNEDICRCVCAHIWKALADEHCRLANEHVRNSLSPSDLDVSWAPGDDGEYSVVAVPLIGLEI